MTVVTKMHKTLLVCHVMIMKMSC